MKPPITIELKLDEEIMVEHRFENVESAAMNVSANLKQMSHEQGAAIIRQLMSGASSATAFINKDLTATITISGHPET